MFIIKLMKVCRASIVCDMKVCFVAEVGWDSGSTWGYWEKSTKIKEFFLLNDPSKFVWIHLNVLLVQNFCIKCNRTVKCPHQLVYQSHDSMITCSIKSAGGHLK